MTSATPCSRSNAVNAGSRKLSWRGSTAWRSGRSASVVVRARPSRRSSCPSERRGGSAGGGVEAHPRRQLPENRAQLGAERQDAGGQEVRQRRLDVAQLLEVGDEPRALDGEDEVVRGLRRPRLPALRTLQGVEGAVDLDAVHAP